MTNLTRDIAEKFTALALAHVSREYPNKLDHVLVSAADALGPRALHPIFFGSFDWHSCVHGYWLLARLLRRYRDLSLAGEIEALCLGCHAPTAHAEAAATGAALTLAIRPELVSIARDRARLAGDAETTTAAVVRNRIFLGEHTEYLVESEIFGQLLVLTPKRLETETGGFTPGDQVHVGWSRSAALVLPDD